LLLRASAQLWARSFDKNSGILHKQKVNLSCQQN
jgi:hypothetical protein